MPNGLVKRFSKMLPIAIQGRSQNFKKVPQNFTEVFNVDDIIANDVIQGKQHRKGKKINLSSIVITDVKLAL